MNKISVITTTFNSEDTIISTVKSVLNQTFTNFEYLIIDDGSLDSTLKKLSRILDDRVRVYKIGKVGRARALNFGLQKAKGKYISIIDSDDIYYKDKLKVQYEFLALHSDIDIVCTNANIVDIFNEKIGIYNTSKNNEDIIKSLLNLNCFPHSTVMYKKEVANKIGGYNERCEKSIDFNFYLDLITSGYKFHGINKILIKFRFYSNSWGRNDDEGVQIQYALMGLLNFYQKQNNQVGVLSAKNKDWEKTKRIFKMWFDDQKYLNQIQAKRFFNEAKLKLIKGDYRSFLHNFFKAFLCDNLFFTYRGIKFKYPKDIFRLYNYLNKKYKIIL